MPGLPMTQVSAANGTKPGALSTESCKLYYREGRSLPAGGQNPTPVRRLRTHPESGSPPPHHLCPLTPTPLPPPGLCPLPCIMNFLSRLYSNVTSSMKASWIPPFSVPVPVFPASSTQQALRAEDSYSSSVMGNSLYHKIFQALHNPGDNS